MNADTGLCTSDAIAGIVYSGRGETEDEAIRRGRGERNWIEAELKSLSQNCTGKLPLKRTLELTVQIVD